MRLTALANEAFRDPGAGLFGAVIAQDALLRHLLASGVATALDLITPTLVPSVAPVAPLPPGVRRVDLLDFPATLCDAPRLVLTGGPSTHRFGLVREAIGGGFATATLMHAAGWIDLPLHYNMMALTSSECDAIVATSRAAELAVRECVTNVEERTGTRLRAQIVRIPLAVESPAPATRSRSNIRLQLGIPLDACVALYVGRFSEAYKADLAPLVNAAVAVRGETGSLHIVLAGPADGPYFERLRALVRATEAAPHTTFVAGPSDEVKADLFRSSDIFVSPVDNIQESFGLTVLEAMSHGLPIVASDWSGYRDLVGHGETGFLTPTFIHQEAAVVATALGGLDTGYGPSEFLARHTVVDTALLAIHLRTLAANETLRRRFGDEGQRRAREVFSWPAVTEQYRALFTMQFERLRQSPIPRRPLRVAEAFTTYASDVFADDALVTAGDTGRALLRALAGAPADEPHASAGIRSVLRRARSPVSLRRLLARRTHKEQLEVLRLIKHGALVFPSRGTGRTRTPRVVGR